MEYAGLIFDDSKHYLDHLAPFCSLMNWPLILCEPELVQLAEKFYPELEIQSAHALTVKLPANVLSCNTSIHIQAAFPYQKSNVLWLPHGNSDKGNSSPFFEALTNEKITLVYGQKMIDFMREKKVLLKQIRIGNFRHEYFQKHLHFYQKAIQLPPGKNFLYAPTWDDVENNNSFWKSFPNLLKHVPADYHLLVKLHPNTLKKYAVELEILKGRLRQQERLIFLDDLPPIYPILNRTAAYIGDMSSIGYDFLTFDRPLFFLGADQPFPLHRCGENLELNRFNFTPNKKFILPRQDLYQYTFDPPPNWNVIQDELDALCSS
jgi:CDP-glycerol glycerophosphotransferase (TagB/SpsB family)